MSSQFAANPGASQWQAAKWANADSTVHSMHVPSKTGIRGGHLSVERSHFIERQYRSQDMVIAVSWQDVNGGIRDMSYDSNCLSKTFSVTCQANQHSTAWRHLENYCDYYSYAKFRTESGMQVSVLSQYMFLLDGWASEAPAQQLVPTGIVIYAPLDC